MPSDMTLPAQDVGPPPTACSGTAGGPTLARRLCWLPHPPRPSRSLTVRLSLLILLSALISRSRAQLDPVRNFCRRFGHQTAVIDRKLYIDGGFINYNPLSQYPANYSSEFSPRDAKRLPPPANC